MSAKHTPGPWAAHHDHGWLVVESSNGDMLIKIEKGSAAKKHIADALLIAAAPELLDALKDLLDREWQDDEGDYTLEMARRKARAAIAKAIG